MKIPLFFIALAFVLGGIVAYVYFGLRTPIVLDFVPSAAVTVTQQDGQIPAIVEPKYDSISTADTYLNDLGYGIVVEVDAKSRFYPFQILVWHEVVNDVLAGKSLLVSYCPLTYTPAVYVRETTGEPLVFHLTGEVLNSNSLLQDDQTGSIWEQSTGTMVEGDLVGTTLTPYPSYVISWATYKKEYPYGLVLSNQTGESRDYTQDPYEQRGYYSSSAVWFPLSQEDERLPPKTLVYGWQKDDQFWAFQLDMIQDSDTIEMQIEESLFRIEWDQDLQIPRAYLDEVEQNLQLAYWFSWFASYPLTQIYSLTI